MTIYVVSNISMGTPLLAVNTMSFEKRICEIAYNFGTQFCCYPRSASRGRSRAMFFGSSSRAGDRGRADFYGKSEEDWGDADGWSEAGSPRAKKNRGTLAASQLAGQVRGGVSLVQQKTADAVKAAAPVMQTAAQAASEAAAGDDAVEKRNQVFHCKFFSFANVVDLRVGRVIKSSTIGKPVFGEIVADFLQPAPPLTFRDEARSRAAILKISELKHHRKVRNKVKVKLLRNI